MTECTLENRSVPVLLLPGGKGGTLLSLRCSGIREGQISVGNVRAAIARGKSFLDLATLPDGEYPAMLTVGTRTVAVALLRKHGGTLEDLTYAPSRVLALEADLALLKKRLSEAEKTIDTLCEKIGRETVFSL